VNLFLPHLEQILVLGTILLLLITWGMAIIGASLVSYNIVVTLIYNVLTICVITRLTKKKLNHGYKR